MCDLATKASWQLAALGTAQVVRKLESVPAEHGCLGRTKEEHPECFRCFGRGSRYRSRVEPLFQRCGMDGVCGCGLRDLRGMESSHCICTSDRQCRPLTISSRAAYPRLLYDSWSRRRGRGPGGERTLICHLEQRAAELVCRSNWSWTFLTRTMVVRSR